MRIGNLDHLVMTTQDLDDCLHFYVDVLGMRCERSNGRYSVRFGTGDFEKFNIHTRKAEFLPAAAHPTYGSLDLRLVVDEKIDAVRREVEESGYPIEEGPVVRYGARGEMQSIYLRDPDGNLIEVAPDVVGDPDFSPTCVWCGTGYGTPAPATSMGFSLNAAFSYRLLPKNASSLSNGMTSRLS